MNKKLWWAIIAAALLASCATIMDGIQNIRVPDFFHPPKLEITGAPIDVNLALKPFKVAFTGDARLEQVDDHVIKLTSKSGHLRIPLSKGELIYGLTERLVKDRGPSESQIQEVGSLDRRDEIVWMWHIPSFSNYVPFYISSRGYGLWVEGWNPGVYDIGKTNPDLLDMGFYLGKETFTCYFITGDSFPEIMDRFTKLSGRPILPPKWAYSPWKWRDEHRPVLTDFEGVKMNADLVEDITMYEKLGFPKGIYLIDRPWGQGNYGYGNYNWDPKRFPNAKQMIDMMHKRGWHVMTWGGPWALGYKKDEFGYEARKNGYMIGNRNIDYTNPKAFEWQKAKIVDFMKSSGIDAWKLDRADEYNPSQPDDIYFNGESGFQLHNKYTYLYVKAYYEATKSVRGDDFIIMSRPADNTTTTMSVNYGGDIPGAILVKGKKQGTDLGLRSVIISLQRVAVMGFPTWGSDTGGYEPFRDRDVFARWLEVSCFCPLMEIGGVRSHEPWAMPTEPKYDEEMIKIYHRYTWLHQRLVDYTYALAQRAHETGNPIVHPLFFDWPDDPKVANMWDEYMYGPSLLVAPIWKMNTRSREIYLPKGNWTCLWDSSKKFAGPTTVKMDVPMDRIAVFILDDKASLLPKGLTDGL